MLIFLRRGDYNQYMKKTEDRDRPDIEAAVRGGDWEQAMDGEGPAADATMKQARYWLKIYTEILAMEEKVLERIVDLMARQSPAARREVELTNVPVVVAQAERFRQRLGYWRARIAELDGAGAEKVLALPKVTARPSDDGAATGPPTRRRGGEEPAGRRRKRD